MFHCPVGVWVIEQHAIILSATVRFTTVLTTHVMWKQRDDPQIRMDIKRDKGILL